MVPGTKKFKTFLRLYSGIYWFRSGNFYLLSDSILYSLIIGISVAMFSTLLGVIIGCISGFIGGPLDKLLIFFMDAIIAIPSLPILILLASLFKGDFTLVLVCIVLVLFNWPWPARQARAMSLSIKKTILFMLLYFQDNPY